MLIVTQQLHSVNQGSPNLIPKGPVLAQDFVFAQHLRRSFAPLGAEAISNSALSHPILGGSLQVILAHGSLPALYLHLTSTRGRQPSTTTCDSTDQLITAFNREESRIGHFSAGQIQKTCTHTSPFQRRLGTPTADDYQTLMQLTSVLCAPASVSH